MISKEKITEFVYQRDASFWGSHGRGGKYHKAGKKGRYGATYAKCHKHVMLLLEEGETIKNVPEVLLCKRCFKEID